MGGNFYLFKCFGKKVWQPGCLSLCLFACLFVLWCPITHPHAARVFLSLSGLAVGSRVALQGAYDSPAGLFLGPHPPLPSHFRPKTDKKGSKRERFLYFEMFWQNLDFLSLSLPLSLSFLLSFFASFFLVSLFACFFVYLFLCLLVFCCEVLTPSCFLFILWCPNTVAMRGISSTFGLAVGCPAGL